MDKIKQIWSSIKTYFSNLTIQQRVFWFIAIVILICIFTSCGGSTVNVESNADSTVAVVDSISADTIVVDSIK